MNRRAPTCCILALWLALPTAMPQAAAAETFHGCAGFIDAVPAALSTPGVWCLRRDLASAAASGALISIAGDDVTLDCNGFKLGGLAAGVNTNTTGILASGRHNVTIRNCNIRGFRRGISLSGADLALVHDNRLDQNTQHAIQGSGENAVIRDNVVGDTGSGPAAITEVSAIYWQGAVVVDHNIVQNTVGSNGVNVSVYGIWVRSATGSSVSRNLVRQLTPKGTGTANGIYASNDRNVFIDGNRIATSAADGLGIRCSTGGSSLRDNVAWGLDDPIASACEDDGGNVGR